ncbi:MAG: N-acetylmuramoyl-L-alanine amidase [Eubacteriales bacterium]|nr:N-acetylmuramoyl-L-alanine amidase [Eubacteriales bacterium]
MKRILALLLALTTFSVSARADMILEYNGGQHNYSGPVCSLIVNGKLVSTPLEPIIFNDRALVPVREVFEAMGADVFYVNKTQEINITLDEAYISMQIGSEFIQVNGNRKKIPDGVVPMLIAKLGENAKTMVPVRFVSENLGMNVVYDGAKKQIRINNPAQSTPEYVPSTQINSITTTEGDDSVTVTVKLAEAAEKIGELTFIENSGVLYCDIFGASYTTSNKFTINKGAVLSVRLGEHENYTRIALDTSGAKDYYKKLSSDGTILKITVSGMRTTDAGGSSPSPTQSPTASPKPSTSPTPSASPTPTPAPTPTPEAHIKGEKIIVLDAGHGGSDPGAVYTHEDAEYKEKIINLAVAKKVYNILTANGIRVEMTRSGDTYPTLTERADFANKLGAAMFVSIHSNSFPNNTEVNGIEVYYAKTNNGNRYGLTSKALATSVYKNLIKNTSANQRGVKTAEHAVTRRSEMPAILIELGFVTNKTEAENLYSDKYQDWLADAIATAIIDNMDEVQIPPLKLKISETEGIEEVTDDENH